MHEIIHRCPDCEGEFRRDIEFCPDCQQPLETVERAEGTEAASRRQPLPLPANEAAVPIRDGELYWISELSARLSLSGIPNRIEPTPERCASYRVMVREEDGSRSAEIDAAFFAEQVPEAPQSIAPSEFDRCPSCDSSLPKQAAECPECGLAFPEVGGEPAG